MKEKLIYRKCNDKVLNKRLKAFVELYGREISYELFDVKRDLNDVDPTDMWKEVQVKFKESDVKIHSITNVILKFEDYFDILDGGTYVKLKNSKLVLCLEMPN